ncbi:biotin transporter BioY [Acidicapsa acidisoli]|uniref:biotin transporter BioY n=1 Tax=Acidicapsa acidisoli TaxID=1615681 RepID=UPI0021E0BEAE|nr:biotin transporter BioY [Acidicapsa acidisoli]
MNQIAGTQAVPAGLSEPQSGVSSLLRSAGIVLAGSALVAICAHVSIPLWFTPVPVTLQPFAVLLLGLLLSPRLAAGAMLAYLAEGAAGLPVFTPHGLGGMAQLLGPTGGYLLSYPLVAPAVSAIWRRGRCSFSRGVVVAAAGSLGTLALGALWLGILTHAAPTTILNHAILPFLPGDALKVCAAAGIAAGASRWKRREI